MVAARKGIPAIVTSKELSSWLSCRLITPNLFQAYTGLWARDFNTFSFTKQMQERDVLMYSSEVLELAGKIHASRPERIVFLDHAPHPQLLIHALRMKYGRAALPPLYFHVYGDFTYYARSWAACDRLLRKTRVRLICASDRQVALVSRLTAQGERFTVRCPFPVDARIFRSDKSLRALWRRKLGVADSESLITYAGRLSLQKNISRLTVEIYRLWASGRGRNLRFALAGNFDNLGAPYFGIYTRPGSYYQYWLTLVEQLPKQFRDRVQYLGLLDQRELVGLYNASDVYASLSLHHDEDFGMAPAEALSSGTPVVLTDWAGYSSFDDGLGNCGLAPVQIGERTLTISGPRFQQALREKLELDRGERARAARAQATRERFSIESVTGMLKAIHSRPPEVFKGFDWRLHRLAETMNRSWPVYPQGPVKNSFYEEIYGVYANGK
jgi:glycosyltransferase involved in cell wall biosynthesis